MADGGGLYLRVAPSGAKSWILRTVIQGRRCDLGLGSVTLVSLAEAREQAVHLRKVARAGGDPLAERRRAHRWLPTFEEAARQVHAVHAAGFRNEKHRRCFRHQLLLPRPYLVLTKPLRLDIQCQRGASVKIGWKYLDD